MQFTTKVTNNTEALNGVSVDYRFAWGFGALSPYTNFYFGLGAQNLTTTVPRDENIHTFVLDADAYDHIIISNGLTGDALKQTVDIELTADILAKKGIYLEETIDESGHYLVGFWTVSE